MASKELARILEVDEHDEVHDDEDLPVPPPKRQR